MFIVKPVSFSKSPTMFTYSGAVPGGTTTSNIMGWNGSSAFVSSVTMASAGAVYGSSGCTLGSVAILFGGSNGSPPPAGTTIVQRFTGTTSSIDIAVLPAVTIFSAATAIGSNAFVFGGYNTSAASGQTGYNTIRRYTGTTMSTDSATNIYAYAFEVAATVGSIAYMVGGTVAGQTSGSTWIQSYDGTTASVAGTMPGTGWSNGGSCPAVGFGSNMFYIGGYQNQGGTAQSSIIRFTGSGTASTDSAVLPAPARNSNVGSMDGLIHIATGAPSQLTYDGSTLVTITSSQGISGNNAACTVINAVSMK